jgi:DNA-binding NarL/FixJ family response regulator
MDSAGRSAVLIVEDDRAFRARFQAILGSDPSLNVVGAVDTLALGLQAIEQNSLDALVVDLGLPDGDGTELIRAAARLQPQCAVMVVTVFGDEEHVVSAIEAGAIGYLLKDSSSEDMLGALHDLLAGGSPISPMVARLVLSRMRGPAAASSAPADPSVALSEREAEILTLVAKGFSFAEICDLLAITVNTVKTHVNRSYRKLGVNSRGQAVHEATRLGLIEM